MKPRFTNLVDLSPNDICRKVGRPATDSDMEFYNNDLKTTAIIDFKHNGLTGGHPNTSIHLNSMSLSYQRQKAHHLRCAFFVVITYTKPNEQPNEMFFVIPMNSLGIKAIQDYYHCKLRIQHLWMTPREWSLFMCHVGHIEMNGKIEAMHNLQADVLNYYSLPNITCGKINCNCWQCKLRSQNERWLKVTADF